jgi:hypothetical protein
MTLASAPSVAGEIEVIARNHYLGGLGSLRPFSCYADSSARFSNVSAKYEALTSDPTGLSTYVVSCIKRQFCLSSSVSIRSMRILRGAHRASCSVNHDRRLVMCHRLIMPGCISIRACISKSDRSLNSAGAVSKVSSSDDNRACRPGYLRVIY